MSHPDGLYEIHPTGSSDFLSILHPQSNAAVCLVPLGAKHAAQLWEARTNLNGRTVLRNITYGTYVSFHGAHEGNPLVGTTSQCEWIAKLLPDCIGLHEEYNLQVAFGFGTEVEVENTTVSGPVTLPVQHLFANPAKKQIYPIPVELFEGPHPNKPAAWTFRRILLESETKRA